MSRYRRQSAFGLISFTNPAAQKYTVASCSIGIHTAIMGEVMSHLMVAVPCASSIRATQATAFVRSDRKRAVSSFYLQSESDDFKTLLHGIKLFFVKRVAHDVGP